MAGAVALAGLGLVAYLWAAVPVYEADVLFQVEERKSTAAAALTDLPTALAGPQSQASTEIEVLRSRGILGSVIDELGLDVLAVPKYFPVIGQPLARRYAGPGIRSAVLGMSRYGWGGERIDVARLDLPAALDDYTVSYTLIARGEGRFELKDGSGSTVLDGVVGSAASASIRVGHGDEKLVLVVRELQAHPGTQFGIVRMSRGSAVRNLQGALKLSEKGRKTGIIRASLQGADPDRTVTILNTLAKTYLRHNVERRSAEAERTLAFLETQLPVLRDNLYAAEAALETYRSRKGNVGVDLSLATKATLDRAVEVEKRLSEIEMQRKEMRHRYTETHPVLQSMSEKVAQLRTERDALNEQIQHLPEAESSSLRLMRDVKVANELYVTLLNKAQELKVMKSGLIGNVQILDLAVRPDVRVSPNKTDAATIALAMGLLGGVALAFARKALQQGVVDPGDAERAVGIPARAAIPHSDQQGALLRAAKAGDGRWPVLAAMDGSDMAVEALRSLRTSLQFALSEAPSRIIAVGGPRPGVGKSFVTINLARVFADAGSRVLVLDADLRKGSLHRYVGVDRSPGLAELITGATDLDQTLRHTEMPNVDFLPRGAAPPNPSEILGSDRFRHVVGYLARSYDIVLVDLPPILAVTDAALVGRLAGINLLVLRAGWHPVREIRLAVRQYAEVGVQLNGLVFNGVRVGGGSSRYGGYQYHYQYSYK